MSRHNYYSKQLQPHTTSQGKNTKGTRDLTQVPVNILLLGTSGNGKSASGNSIIGKKVFHTSSGSTSVESSVVKNMKKWRDIEINVVDIPGVDAYNSSDEVLNKCKIFIGQAFEKCPDGFSALVFVLKFGNRFVKQERDMLKLIRSTFGDSVIKNNVIVIYTHGDLFEEEVNQGGNADRLDIWCIKQDSSKPTLFEECEYTRVPFNNNAKDEQNNLKNLASKIMKETHRFLQKERHKMSEIESFRDMTKEIKELSTILKEIKDYHKEISESGCIFHKTNNPTNYIRILESEIKSKIKLKEIERLQCTTYRFSDVQFYEAGTNQHQNRSDSPKLEDRPLNFSRGLQSRSMHIRKRSGLEFTKQVDESNQFNIWCREQSGDLKRLFEECDYRCVLFNNRTKDIVTQCEQLQTLLNYIKKTRPYGKNDFLLAETERKEAELKRLESKEIQDTHEFLQEKRHKTSEIEILSDVNKQIKDLKAIVNELKDFHEEISESGCIFNKANNPTNYICALESKIESKIKLKELERLQSTSYRESDIQFNRAGNDQRRIRSDLPELDELDKQ